MIKGFRRHKTTEKNFLGKGDLNFFRPPAFSVGQEHSLESCSPAELSSAYPDKANVNSPNKYEQEMFSTIFRV